jgi:hypothetical protein
MTPTPSADTQSRKPRLTMKGMKSVKVIPFLSQGLRTAAIQQFVGVC